MDSVNLRKIAAELREVAAASDERRRVKAAQVLDAAVAIYKLQQKVRRDA